MKVKDIVPSQLWRPYHPVNHEGHTTQSTMKDKNILSSQPWRSYHPVNHDGHRHTVQSTVKVIPPSQPWELYHTVSHEGHTTHLPIKVRHTAQSTVKVIYTTLSAMKDIPPYQPWMLYYDETQYSVSQVKVIQCFHIHCFMSEELLEKTKTKTKKERKNLNQMRSHLLEGRNSWQLAKHAELHYICYVCQQ